MCMLHVLLGAIRYVYSSTPSAHPVRPRTQAFVAGDAGEISGDTFEQLTHVYVQYVNNYEQSQSKLRSCRERPYCVSYAHYVL